MNLRRNFDTRHKERRYLDAELDSIVESNGDLGSLIQQYGISKQEARWALKLHGATTYNLMDSVLMVNELFKDKDHRFLISEALDLGIKYKRDPQEMMGYLKSFKDITYKMLEEQVPLDPESWTGVKYNDKIYFFPKDLLDPKKVFKPENFEDPIILKGNMVVVTEKKDRHPSKEIQFSDLEGNEAIDYRAQGEPSLEEELWRDDGNYQPMNHNSWNYNKITLPNALFSIHKDKVEDASHYAEHMDVSAQDSELPQIFLEHLKENGYRVALQ